MNANSIEQQITGRPDKQTLRSENRVRHAKLATRFFQSRGIRFGVYEVQWIIRRDVRVVLNPAPVEQQFQSLLGIEPEVVLALGTWDRPGRCSRGPFSKQWFDTQCT